MNKIKEIVKNFGESMGHEMILPKGYLVMGGVILFLLGIIEGLCMAPLTHGFTIGSYNVTDNSVDKDKEDE